VAGPPTAHISNAQAGGDIIAAGLVNIFEGLPTPAKPGRALLVPGLFIGRDDSLRELKRQLGILPVGEGLSAKSESMIVVRGWPGVGKTTTAAALAHDLEVEHAFEEGILWTSLGEKPSLLSALASWGQALGTDEVLRAPTLTEATSQLGALLREKHMLLIVDDAWETAHAEPFRQARGSKCVLVVTTRLPVVAEALAPTPGAIYNLPVLTEEYALELFRALAPSVVQDHPQEALELVQQLECLPLAIQVAGRTLNAEHAKGWGVADLIEDLRTARSGPIAGHYNLLEAHAPADRADLEMGTIPTVSALLKQSTDRLDEYTRDCFAYLGAFAPKPATFDLAAMAAVWEVTDPKPIARQLIDRGLLEPLGAGRFQMHALLVMHAQILASD
jgi:DNA polymerase III delta prime subunit